MNENLTPPAKNVFSKFVPTGFISYAKKGKVKNFVNYENLLFAEKFVLNSFAYDVTD